MQRMGLTFMLLAAFALIAPQALAAKKTGFSVKSKKAAGDKGKRKSPTWHVTVKHKKATIKIVYARPSKRGRKLFGGLVPFGKIWRTGANEATTLETNRALKIKGKTLKPGKYALFTIPGKKSWVVIFNTNANQWGAYSYSAKKDVFRVTVKARKNKLAKKFTISANAKKLILKWGTTHIKIPYSL